MTKKVDRKKMPECVRAAPKARGSKTLLQVVELSEKVTLAELITGSGWKQERPLGRPKLVYDFPKLKGKRHKPVFIALTSDGENQVLQIYVRRAQGEAFIDSEAGIGERQYYRLESPLCPGCGNPLYKPQHLLNCRGY